MKKIEFALLTFSPLVYFIYICWTYLVFATAGGPDNPRGHV